MMKMHKKLIQHSFHEIKATIDHLEEMGTIQALESADATPKELESAFNDFEIYFPRLDIHIRRILQELEYPIQ